MIQTRVPAPSAIAVFFYRMASASKPVRDWLGSLSVEDRRKTGHDLALVQ